MSRHDGRMDLDVDATVLLCDAAVADPTGKVHMLGAGWSSTGSPTPPCAVVALMKIPWDRANQPLPMELDLVDSDGQPVLMPTPTGPQGLKVTRTIEVGRPAGLAHGSPLDSAFVLNLSPLPLAPGRYEWRLTLAGKAFGVAFGVVGSAR